MNYFEAVKGALLTVTDRVSHFNAHKAAAPYIVWAEDGGDELHADNVIVGSVIEGTVDYYTPDEVDPAVEQIPDALSAVCAVHLNSIQYEEDTGLIHWEWVWMYG